MKKSNEILPTKLIDKRKILKLPVCTPALIVIVRGAMSGLTTLPQAALRSKAILQISAACLKNEMKICTNHMILPYSRNYKAQKYIANIMALMLTYRHFSLVLQNVLPLDLRNMTYENMLNKQKR